MTITVDDWAEKSRRGEVCGILGCQNKPVKKCPHCGNHYCQEHAFVLNTPGHPRKGGEAVTEQFKLQSADVLVNVNDRTDPWSSLERWGVGPFSHVFLYLGRMGLFVYRKQPRILRVPMIFESVPAQGVCLRQLSERYGEKVVVMRLKSEHDRRRIPHVLLAAIDLASDNEAQYDFICIPLHIIPRIFNEKFGMPIPVKYHRDERQVCSEGVQVVFIRGQLPDILGPLCTPPLPGDFVIDSPLLEEVNRGILSEDWV